MAKIKYTATNLSGDEETFVITVAKASGTEEQELFKDEVSAGASAPTKSVKLVKSPKHFASAEAGDLSTEVSTDRDDIASVTAVLDLDEFDGAILQLSAYDAKGKPIGSASCPKPAPRGTAAAARAARAKKITE